MSLTPFLLIAEIVRTRPLKGNADMNRVRRLKQELHSKTQTRHIARRRGSLSSSKRRIAYANDPRFTFHEADSQ